MKARDLDEYLELVLWPRCQLFPSLEISQKAVQVHETLQYGYYDSLIVASALASGAKVLYSEDLQHGRVIGDLKIVNPFLT